MNNRALAQDTIVPEARELVIPRPGMPPVPYKTPYIDHWVVQLQGVAPELMSDPERLEGLLTGIVDELGLTRVSSHTHHFVPGVSSVIILSESHLSAHTWPECEYMHVDIVTCVPRLDEVGVQRAFRRAFAPTQCELAHLDYVR